MGGESSFVDFSIVLEASATCMWGEPGRLSTRGALRFFSASYESRALTLFRCGGERTSRDGNGELGVEARRPRAFWRLRCASLRRPIALKRDGDPRNGLRQQGSASRRDFTAPIRRAPRCAQSLLRAGSEVVPLHVFSVGQGRRLLISRMKCRSKRPFDSPSVARRSLRVTASELIVARRSGQRIVEGSLTMTGLFLSRGICAMCRSRWCGTHAGILGAWGLLKGL